jgi:1,4-dihydroxy-2-naphthoate octaprenyltransferase
MPTSTKLSKIIATSRPAFLILTPCCLLPAIAFAVVKHIPLSYPHLLLIFIGAMAAHISVNMFNEYGDFSSGLDFNTQRTAFSGGSGALPSSPELAPSVRTTAIVSLLITIAIGCYFIWIYGWGLLPIGLPGVLLVCFYTSKVTHSPLLCLIAPGLAFGPLMICGAYFALSGQYSLAVFGMSFMVFFLVNNLLLLNQFPDITADEDAGRRHLPILIGRKKSAWLYVTFLLAAYAALAASVWLSWLPAYGLLGLLTVLLAVPAAKIAVEYADDIERLKPALTLNVIITLATPLLVAAGLFLAALP